MLHIEIAIVARGNDLTALEIRMLLWVPTPMHGTFQTIQFERGSAWQRGQRVDPRVAWPTHLVAATLLGMVAATETVAAAVAEVAMTPF